MEKYHFGVEVDLTDFVFLEDNLRKAYTTAPQPVRETLSDKTPSEKLCVAVHENQIALADAKSCRYLSSAGTASCRAFFLRNPKTSATVVVHLHAGSEEDSFKAAIKRVAQRGDELDMYIMGGQSRCDYTADEAHAGSLKNFEPDTISEIEETLDNIYAVTDDLGVKVNVKVINLHAAKQTPNAVIDTVTGDFFYVPDKVIKPFILYSMLEESRIDQGNGPLLNVFDGLEKKVQIS